jgi:hypothetical protein
MALVMTIIRQYFTPACHKIILGAHKLEVDHVFPKPFEDIDYILDQIKRIMGG